MDGELVQMKNLNKILKITLINALLLTGIQNDVMSSSSDNNKEVQDTNTKTQRITQIKYVGCERIEKETIESYLPIQVGDECDDHVINESIKLLYSTGFFESVNITRNNGILTVSVKEYPIIEKISFEGNSKISDKDIKQVTSLKSREVLSPSKIREIQQSLLDAYRKMGRYNASINPKIIKLPNNKVNLVFEINEGNAAGIRNIKFVGNNAFSASTLRDVISSKIKRWYRFFVTDDIYDQDRLMEDKILLTRFYKENGYTNCHIISSIGTLSEDKKDFDITFTIDEGEIQKLSNVNIESKIKNIDPNEFKNDLYCKKGDVYNIQLIEADISTITRKVSSKGIAAVKVTPKFTQNSKNNTIDITYVIEEGEKIYISKIIIKGNTRTRDKVIRREIPIEEGDAYNTSLISMAEQNLRATGFFKQVNFETIPDPNSPDRCVVQVTVEEQPTGEVSAAASYSTSEKIGLDLSYSERNFLGTGKTFGASLGSGESRTGKSYEITEDNKKKSIHRKSKFKFFNSINIYASDPHFLDKDMEGSASLFKYNSSRFDGFSTREMGTTLGISYDLTSKIQQDFEYTFNKRKFFDVMSSSSPIIKYNAAKNKNSKVLRCGSANLSSLKHGISYTNYFLTGLKGTFRTGLNTTVAGIGGESRHLKNNLFASYTFPVFNKKTLLSLSLSYAVMNKIGKKDLNIVDSYSLGLDSFRGFDDCGFGPMAETTRIIRINNDDKKSTVRDYIGATKYWKGTIEMSFPLGLPEELQFRGFVFSDFGSLWGAPQKGKAFFKKTGDGRMICDFDPTVYDHKIIDKKQFKSSIGLGVSFITPFGPLKLTYAKPIKKDKLDEQQRFLVGFSTTF